ncbi:hypothetical protein CMO84_05805 [Candidatus Woesearchaeota archaeon]|nr:hypothetical protein [Candidatus Woesearchaeota archaeon]
MQPRLIHLALVLLGVPILAESSQSSSTLPGVCSATRVGEPAPPNIVVVVFDDLGLDRLGFYGQSTTPATTPVLSGLASKGLVFMQAWANPVCGPTRALIQSGLYGIHTGIGENPSDKNHGLPATADVLPNRLPVAYTSLMVGKWHLGDDLQGPTHPNDVGYGLYSGSLRNLVLSGGDYFRWQHTLNGSTGGNATYAPTVNIDDSIRVLATLPEPFMLHVNYNSVHTPLHAPPPDLHTQNLPPKPNKNPIPYVNAMTEAADTELGRLLAELPANTYVIMVSDNGPFNKTVEPPLDPNRVKGTLYQGGIRVPMLIVGPGVNPGRVNAPVGVVDLFATIIELAGGTLPAVTDSVSLVPYFSDPSLSLRTYVYSERFRPNGVNNPQYRYRTRTVRDSQYKLLRRMGSHDEFYDLLADPYERINLLDKGLTPKQQAALTRISDYMEGL